MAGVGVEVVPKIEGILRRLKRQGIEDNAKCNQEAGSEDIAASEDAHIQCAHRGIIK